MAIMTSHFRKREKMLAACEGARKLARLSHVLYWIGKILAILILSAAIAFAAIDMEPMFQRIASVFVLGVIPALFTWASALVISHLLKEASALYDRIATALRWASRSLGLLNKKNEWSHAGRIIKAPIQIV